MVAKPIPVAVSSLRDTPMKGHRPRNFTNTKLLTRIVLRPRARELAAWEPEELSLEEMRAKFGGAGTSDEELMLRWLLTQEEIAAMRAAPPPREYATARHPLVTLVAELAARKDIAHIEVEKSGVSVTLTRPG